jgi:hypothetical protein
METWKKLEKYNGWTFPEKYEVSESGHVRNIFTHKMLYEHETGGGHYLKIIIKDTDGVSRHIKLHRLVAYTFLGEPGESDLEVDHINRNKHDNHFTNLRWCSHKQNMKYYKDFTPKAQLALW